MQNNLKHLSPAQQAELTTAIQKIAAETNAEKIYCFGHRSTQKTEWSLFNSSAVTDNNIDISYYDLLLVMPDKDTRYKDKIEGIANRPITLHTSFTYQAFTHFAFNNLLKNGNPFVIKICRDAALLYTNNAHPVGQNDIPRPNPCFANTANLHWVRTINMARQEYRMAERASQINERCRALNYLEQSACHVCMALITLYTGHRQEMLMLSQLLQYCDNFCTIRTRVFPCNTTEEAQLFLLLERAVLTAGTPHHEQPIAAITMNILLRRGNKMLELADWLYTRKTGGQRTPARAPFDKLRVTAGAQPSHQQSQGDSPRATFP